MGKDYYEVLGINKGASESDIKKAYYRLILLYHPDKKRCPDAAKFNEVLEAYKFLMIPENRIEREPDANQDPPVEHEFYVTLSDILIGCEKKMKITRRVINPDGSTRREDKILIINVIPGCKAGTKITFPKEGDQFQGRIPANIIFIIRDRPHAFFKREGSNIKCSVKLSLKQAILDFIVEIPSLTSETITLNLNQETVRPDTVKVIQGYGLPIPNGSSLKGDILVSFDIQFPKITQSCGDYYKLLSINRDASDDEIKKAYDKFLHPKCHTDKNKNSSANKEDSDGDPSDDESPSSTPKRPPKYSSYSKMEYDLPVTLEDVLLGCIRDIIVPRTVILPNGKTIMEDEIFTVYVDRGCQAGTTITSHKDGDHTRGTVPMDVVFTIKDKPHALFTREDSNIRYIKTLSLEEAVLGTIFKIPTLTSEEISLDMTTEIVRPNTEKKFPGYGLPFPSHPSLTGDLLVSFDIKFPDTFSQTAKDYYNVLRTNRNDSDDEIKITYIKQFFDWQSFYFHGSSKDRCTNKGSFEFPVMERELYVTLDDIFKGCTKKMKITRRVVDFYGNTKSEEKILIIDVKPGWKEGTRITFHKEGDRIYGKIPADIVFIIRDRPHAFFTRQGSDIACVIKLSLDQAVCGFIVEVPSLVGDPIILNLSTEVVKPNTVKRYPGRGLPFPKNPLLKGDLLVSFDIKLPGTLALNSESYFYKILGINKYAIDDVIKAAYLKLNSRLRSGHNRKF